MPYTYISKRRTGLHHFIKGNDAYSKIAVINTKKNNISDITRGQDYLDEVYKYLIDECQFPVDNCATFYLFDRNPESNTNSELFLEYIDSLRNPYENESLKAGQLLLSYPSVESYIISCFQDNSFAINNGLNSDRKLRLGSNLKTYIGNNRGIQLNKLSVESLLHATQEFVNFLEDSDIKLDIDDFSEASKSIFCQQERSYSVYNCYSLFSMLTLAFL